jgi:tripartite ATP-independent transporter DctM subunit
MWSLDFLLPALMFLTLGVLLFSGYPVGFVLGGVGLAFGIIGIALGVLNPLRLFNFLPRIYGGVVANQVLVAIPMFIFMGTVFERSGVAHELLRCLQVLFRRIPGGLAMAVTIMGTIMAATTGIVGASVVILTMIALPTMIERGYNKPLATGTIAAAGTLGVLIPPSIMLVVMGDLLQIPVGTLFLGAVMPGLLLCGLYLAYIYFLSMFRPELAPPLPKELAPVSTAELVTMMLHGFLPPVFLIFVVLGSIYLGWATPTEASGMGSLGALLIAFWKKRLDRKTVREILDSTALTNSMVFLIFIGATMFSLIFRMLGGDEMIIHVFKQFGLGPWGVMIFILILVFLLGFFFEWIEITLIVLPVFVPVLMKLSFEDHLIGPRDFLPWFAIVCAVNLQTSFLTPPFGFTLFYMKGTVPPSVSMIDIYRGIIPFVLLQLTGMLLCVIFPEIALWMPRRAGALD